jgi:hypothetical protein
MKRLQNSKAASPDGIPAEVLIKADVQTIANMLLPLFERIWDQEVPANWKDK